MQLATAECLDSSSSAKSLLRCSSALGRLTAKLERQLEGSPPRTDAPVLEPLSNVSVTWEKDLIAASAMHLLEAFHPEWVLVSLDDATNLMFRLHTPTGHASAVHELPESVRQSVLEWVREATAAARPIYVPDPRSDKRFDALAEIVPSTHSMFVVPLGGNKAGSAGNQKREAGSKKSEASGEKQEVRNERREEGAILLGFEAGQGEPSPTALEWLAQATGQIGASLFGNRQIEKRIAAAQKEFERTAAAKSLHSSAACPLGTVITVSLVPPTNSGEAGDRDYCAIVTAPTGKVRLFVARLAAQGVERIWETLALDVAFRAACVLCKYPAEIASMMNRVWVGTGGDFGLVRHICCADVADSGREYVFAGSTTHLLYESSAQAVSELFERLPDETDADDLWDGQHVRLHSGDVVILHTCDLPLSLPKRHEVFRRLAALLAREGRRPMADIASQVASLLCNGTAPGLPHPAVFVLRAE